MEKKNNNNNKQILKLIADVSRNHSQGKVNKFCLENGVMTPKKRWLFTLIFTCLCFKKSLLSNVLSKATLWARNNILTCFSVITGSLQKTTTMTYLAVAAVL